MIDTSGMTRDELLVLLSSLESENNALKLDFKNIKSQLKRSKEDLKKSKIELNNSKKLVESLQEERKAPDQQLRDQDEQLQRYHTLLEEVTDVGKHTFLIREFGEQIKTFHQTIVQAVDVRDPVVNKQMCKMFFELIDEFLVVFNRKDDLIRRLFANGKSEKLPPIGDVQNAISSTKGEIEKTVRSLRARIATLSDVGQFINEALKEMKSEDPLAQSMKQIANTVPPERPISETKKTPWSSASQKSLQPPIED